MSKKTRGSKQYSRRENCRERQKPVTDRSLLTFSFRDIDETQPSNETQTIALWEREGLLKPLFHKLKELSKLKRIEAESCGAIKVYNKVPFPPKTDFVHPKHVPQGVHWAVVQSLGGQKGRVAGYIVENTFYVVFLDQNHRFWITDKKNT